MGRDAAMEMDSLVRHHAAAPWSLPAPQTLAEREELLLVQHAMEGFFGFFFVVVSLPDLIMWKALFLTMIYSSPLPLFCAGCSNGEASSAGHPPPLPCIHLLPPYMVSYNLSF